MDGPSEEIFLQRLEELVIDADKIVTNAVVCEQLEVSLSDSNHILKKYVSDGNQCDPGNLLVTYLISGKLKTGEYSIQIFDSVVLKDKKKLFSTITNEVVYSVQKSNNFDTNIIALAEKVQTSKTEPLKGSIVGERCTERSIKSKVLPPLPPQKNFEKQKSTPFFKPSVKIEANSEKTATQSTSSNSNKTQTNKKTGGLAGFFSQASNNESKQQTRKKSSSDDDLREAKRCKIETESCELNKDEIKVEDVPETDDSKPLFQKNEEEPKKKANGKQSSKKENVKNKSEGKKRKRIILQSDSEDDLFGNNDEEEKMDVHSEEEKPVITQPKEIIPKNKRRKAVEKVYTDDEGFVVTKTEYVLVSASEDEESEVTDNKPKVEPKPVQKQEKKSPPQKAAAKGKKGKSVGANQPTLMSFFQKK